MSNVLCTHVLLECFCSFCEPGQEHVFYNKAGKDKLENYLMHGQTYLTNKDRSVGKNTI